MIHVTEKNVDFISSHKLGDRYRVIQRLLNSQNVLLNPDLYENLKLELDLIHENLILRGATNQLSEQMALPGIEVPTKEAYEEILLDLLDQHRRKIMRLEYLKKELEGIEIVFPSCTSSMSLTGVSGGSSQYQSSTERSVLRTIERKEEIKEQISDLEGEIQPLELTINSALDHLERMLIEKKYLSPEKKKDVDVISEMPVEKSKFYEIRRSAFLNLAEALRII